MSGHFHSSRRVAACIRSDSSIYSCHTCSCTCVCMAGASGHTRSDLGYMFFLYNLDDTCTCWLPHILHVYIHVDKPAGTGPRRRASNPSSSRRGRRICTARWMRPSAWATCHRSQPVLRTSRSKSTRTLLSTFPRSYAAVYPNVSAGLQCWDVNDC